MADERQSNSEQVNRGGIVSSMGEMEAWRGQLVRGALRVLSILGALAVIGGSYSELTTRGGRSIPFYVGAYVILLLITFYPRTPYVFQAGTILFLLYGLGVFNLYNAGLAGDEGIFFLATFALAGLFFGRRGGIPALALTIVTLLLGGWAYSTGVWVVKPDTFVASNTSIFSWVSTAIVFFMLSRLIGLSQNTLFTGLGDSLNKSQELAGQLEAARANLEVRVEQRTQELARHSSYLEATAAVAREALGTLDVQELLSRVVSLISDRFGFYHTGIFLLDPTGQWAELKAASSQGGQRMLERGHRLQVGGQGTVGHVAGQGQARIASDVGADAIFFDNPDLPDTRSEVALPLRVRGQIMGVLDVQSTVPQAFSSDDAAVLQTLADQVALAINNAMLFQQAQASLETERRAYGELGRQAWQEMLRAQAGLGFRRSQEGLAPAGDEWRPEMQTAMQTGKAVQEQATTLAVPIKVRDQVIGVIDARKPEGAWTQEQAAVVETLADQLGVALESARLYQDTQRRAAQERLVGQVTARMSETLDMETVLRTAICEMGEALGMAEVEVRMGTPTDGNGYSKSN